MKGGDTIYYSKAGGNINTQLVIYPRIQAGILANLGPVLCLYIYYGFSDMIWDDPGKQWSNVQRQSSLNVSAGFILLGLHYIRRVFECGFVHKYSNPSIIMTSFLYDVFQYGILLGLITCFCLFHPAYVAPNWSRFEFWSLVIGYLITEVLNCYCHIILRDLRPGRISMQIPYVNNTTLIGLWI